MNKVVLQRFTLKLVEKPEVVSQKDKILKDLDTAHVVLLNLPFLMFSMRAARSAIPRVRRSFSKVASRSTKKAVPTTAIMMT